MVSNLDAEGAYAFTMRWAATALLFLALGCTTTTSVTRRGNLFPQPQESEEADEAPRGLTLDIASIEKDGAVTLDLRNYSQEPFVFAGTAERPAFVVEVESGRTRSRHTVSPWGRGKTQEVPPGERVQLKAYVTGLSGRVRIGIRSQEFGWIVWSDWTKV